MGVPRIMKHPAKHEHRLPLRGGKPRKPKAIIDFDSDQDRKSALLGPSCRHG